jgi:hypothetical protein
MTAGGVKAKTMASRMEAKMPMARPARASARRSGRSRRFQSLSLTKAMALFWPLPAKLKPATENTDSTASASSSRKWSSTVRRTARVRGWVAPAGNWTWVKMKPWSSSGRKAVGMRTKNRTMAPTMAA